MTKIAETLVAVHTHTHTHTDNLLINRKEVNLNE